MVSVLTTLPLCCIFFWVFLYIYIYNIATSAPTSRVPPLHREALQVVKRRMEDIDSQLMADTNEAKQVPAGR